MPDPPPRKPVANWFNASDADLALRTPEERAAAIERARLILGSQFPLTPEQIDWASYGPAGVNTTSGPEVLGPEVSTALQEKLGTGPQAVETPDGRAWEIVPEGEVTYGPAEL